MTGLFLGSSEGVWEAFARWSGLINFYNGLYCFQNNAMNFEMKCLKHSTHRKLDNIFILEWPVLFKFHSNSTFIILNVKIIHYDRVGL